MLTKEDLGQIKLVVQDMVKPLEARIGKLEKETGELRKDVVVLRKDVKKLDKKLDFVSAVFDDEKTRLRRKMFSIETNLHLET